MQATWASMVPNMILSLARPLYRNPHPLRFQAAHGGQSPPPREGLFRWKVTVFTGVLGESPQLLPTRPQSACFPPPKETEVREYIS